MPVSRTDPGTGPFLNELKVTRLRRPGRWVAMAVIAVLVAMFIHAAVFARIKRGTSLETRFGWEVVGQYLFTRQLFDALAATIELTAIAMAIGIVGGIVLAVMRLSDNWILSRCSWLYIWFFRGTPVLVQLLFWYNLSYLFPTLSIGIPFGPEFAIFDANNLVTPFSAALIGLGLNEAAYMAEIVRAGIISVDYGQTEASLSLGMSRGQMLRRVLLPQAMRVIIPPTGNQVISMLKTTSLASVITVTELLRSVQLIYARTFQPIPMLIVASLWYLAVTSILTIGQVYVERHFNRGRSGRQPSGRGGTLRRMLTFDRSDGLPPRPLLSDLRGEND